jgi:hypothetical protein
VIAEPTSRAVEPPPLVLPPFLQQLLLGIRPTDFAIVKGPTRPSANDESHRIVGRSSNAIYLMTSSPCIVYHVLDKLLTLINTPSHDPDYPLR